MCALFGKAGGEVWAGLHRVVEEEKMLLIDFFQIWREREGEAELRYMSSLASQPPLHLQVQGVGLQD